MRRSSTGPAGGSGSRHPRSPLNVQNVTQEKPGDVAGEDTARPRSVASDVNKAAGGNVVLDVAFLSSKISGAVMYPWPLGEFDNVMDALLILAHKA
jgi:hypothetical protein